MRAAVYRRRGPAQEVLEVVQRPEPHPGSGEVRVRVAVSGVNPTDHKSRSRREPLEWPEQIPNQDGAGVIDEVGGGVDPSRVGERVWVFNAAFARPEGTAAEFVCTPENRAAPLPAHTSMARGAGLGIPFLTAHHCVYGDGPVEGRTVLVTGGAGAVGNAAIQLARHGGARVIATVSSEEKADLARAAGAEVVVNYRLDGAVDEIRDAAPDGVDRIVEVALATNLDTALAVLARSGVVVTYATEPTAPSLPVRRLMSGLATLRFMLLYHLSDEQLSAGVAGVNALLDAGVSSPLPQHRYPLEAIADAHEAVEAGAVGKVLVDVADEASVTDGR